MEVDIEFRNKAGYKLVGELWLPKIGSPVVITSHGISPLDKADEKYVFGKKYQRLAQALHEEGIGCLNFAHTGYGGSEPYGEDDKDRVKRANSIYQRCQDIRSAISFLEDKEGVDVAGIFGSSYGALAAKVFCCTPRNGAHALVTWNITKPDILDDLRDEGYATEATRMYRVATVREIPSRIPWLFVYGENDKRHGTHEAEKFCEPIGRRHPEFLDRQIVFHKVPGGDHGLESEEHLTNALSVTVPFFKRNLLG